MRLSSSFVSRPLQVLLGIPDVRSKALLSGSSLVHQLCRRSQTSCSELPQIQAFTRALEEILKESSKDKKYSQGHTVGVSSRIYKHFDLTVGAFYAFNLTLFCFKAFICTEVSGEHGPGCSTLHSSIKPLHAGVPGPAGAEAGGYPSLQTLPLLS